jgi:hypothetical protein
VIRADVAVPPEATDPAFGEVNTKYASLRDEVAARADHTVAQYCIDNARVFELLNEAVTEHKNVKTWIKPFAKARDGRGAWFAFKAHYRGSSELEAIETAAEKRLDDLTYKGEMPRYNFETHVSMHRKSHLELEKATGLEMPGPTKVRRLLKSLKSSSMNVPVATIRATDHLRTDFDETVNYLRSFISTIDHDTRHVAQVKQGPSHDKKKGQGNNKKKNKWTKDTSSKGDKDKKLDRWYQPGEWYKLDPATREKITKAREKRKISKVASKADESENVSTDDEVPGGSTSQRSSSKSAKKAKKSDK